MNTNILRLKRKSLLDHFIISFTGNDFIVDYYINVSLPQNWINRNQLNSISKIDISDYEDTLINYFEHPVANNSNHPLLIIIGGMGTGKSSSIRYALANSNICEGCILFSDCPKNYPARILVDFIEFKDDVVVETSFESKKSNKKDLENKFWYHIVHILDEVLNNELDSEKEISEFWHWLVTAKIKSIPMNLYRYLFPKKELFENHQSNSNELLELKERLYNDLTTKQLTYYKLYQIAYLRKDGRVNCNVIIFDNIDTLDPYLQAALINFSLEANRLLDCKAIIPLRPHTFTSNKDASDFFEIMEHWKPSLEKVLNKRLENHIKYGDKEVSFGLEKVISLLRKNNLFREIFVATSGKSIRYGLRNFYNFCLSPLIVTHINNKRNNNFDLDTNTFFQAYFCSELEEQFLDEENYINLFSIRKSKRSSYFSNIKIRFIHLLYTTESLRLGYLKSILKSFGYHKFEINLALNELLSSKKALLWSSTLTSYSKSDIRMGDNHIIYITHLGSKYYESLMNHPMYLRECIVAIDRKRLKLKEHSINRVLEIIKFLEDEDFDEIENFISQNGYEEYKKIFSEQELCISNILWLKLRDNLSKWISGINDLNFDYNRQNFIKKRFNDLTKKFA